MFPAFRYLISLLLCLFLYTHNLAQYNRPEALVLTHKAVKIMQKGKYDDSISLLNRALELDSENIHIQYQLALAHYFQKNYTQCIEILQETTRHPDAPEEHFAFLGNAYDNLGEVEIALKSYQKGLRKYPNSGRLYAEMGILALNEKRLEAAMEYWETGIQQAPTYPENYYWAAKAYALSSEKIWTLIYAEAYILLSAKARRKTEMANLLLDTYPKCIQISGADMVAFSFSRQAFITSEDSKFFGRREESTASFEKTFTAAYQKEAWRYLEEVNAPSLARSRSIFIQNWMASTQEEIPPFNHDILLYLIQVYEAGHWEAYHQWLFEAQNDTWQQDESNDAAYTEFIAWMGAQPFRPAETCQMSRLCFQ